MARTLGSSLAGPVASVVIDYDNGGMTTQLVNLSDVTFQTIATVEENNGNDVLFGGAGDTVDGSATGSHQDVLDLTGQGPFILENVVSDTDTGGNGNGFNGTVVFVDNNGKKSIQLTRKIKKGIRTQTVILIL